MASRRLARAIQAISTLGEPQRFRLYEFVSQSDEPVTRDQAAQSLDMKRGIVSFHLDKLVEEGLLDVEHKRLGDKTGPGAGRPSKLYKRSSNEIDASAPERHYDTAAQLLADGIQRSTTSNVSVAEGVQEAAQQYGKILAGEFKDTNETINSERMCEFIEQHGYEPTRQGEDIVLRNCPFHRLAAQHTDLVCNMNLAVFEALTDSIDGIELQPRLEPEADHCCVKLRDES